MILSNIRQGDNHHIYNSFILLSKIRRRTLR